MKIRNRIAVLTLSLIMAITYMPAMAFAETGEAETGSQQMEAAADGEANEESADITDAAAAIDKSEMVSKKLTVDIGDSDELLTEYFEKQFGVQDTPKPGLLRASKLPRREKLSEAGKAAYDEMLPQIKAIAAGTQREPVVTYNSEDFGEGDDAFDILTAMAIDYPYEFYWYDKTQTVHYNAYRVIMPVAEAYRGELIDADYEIYALDTAKIASANQAADNAREIVDKYKNFNDFSKLRNYKNEICDLNEYNQAAADDWDTPYGDPWQMIYVFDGDPETNVVCEGYSKAFQFLCDNSKFQSDQVECFTVTGKMVPGDYVLDEGMEVFPNHMWNVLRMDDGKVYIADITNADSEFTAQSNALFLGGAMPYNSYKLLKFSFYGDGADISYAYDQDTIDLYDESELAVSTSPYKCEIITELTAENVEVSDVVYTGAALEPEITVTVDGTVLTEGRDYEVAYSNNVNAGTGTVTVTGIVSYSGEVTASFTIRPKAITPAVTLSTVNYTWNGKVKTPAVTVKYGSKVLKNGTDYNVAYQAGRKNIGRYSVTVTLKGNYSGKKAATFNINPKGTTAYKPKAAKKAFTAKWKKLTTKMPKAKVTGYQVQYSTNKTFKTGAKTVTVKGATKTSRKISGLKKKTTYYVRVRTYISVGGRYYYSTWSAVKSVKTK